MNGNFIRLLNAVVCMFFVSNVAANASNGFKVNQDKVQEWINYYKEHFEGKSDKEVDELITLRLQQIERQLPEVKSQGQIRRLKMEKNWLVDKWGQIHGLQDYKSLLSEVYKNPNLLVQ